MPLDRQGALAGSTGSRCRVFYQDGEWKEVPGIGSFELAPSTRTSTTYSAFEGAFSTTGAQEIGAATFEVASFLPNHRAWAYLDKQFRANDNVQLRVETTKTDVFISGDGTVAIDTSGVCTFSNGVVDQMSNVARGHQILSGTRAFTIESITDATPPVFTVKPDGSALAAAKFSVIMPIIRWQITGKLSSSGGSSVSEDAVNSAQFIVQPAALVPLPEVVTKHTGE